MENWISATRDWRRKAPEKRNEQQSQAPRLLYEWPHLGDESAATCCNNRTV
jgi:hypothetical protein